MAYSNEIYQYARDVLAQRRQKAVQTLQERRQELYLRFPRFEEIEAQLRLTGMAAVRAAMSPNGKEKLDEIRQVNLDLQEERRQMLSSLGLPQDYLSEPYVCPLCKDEGFVDGKRCACFEKLVREESFRRLNRLSPLSLSDFDNFDLSYYSSVSDGTAPSAFEQMKKIYQYCKRYAENFSSHSANLLMSGRTGLGKTHLSLAIAKAAIQKGCGVIYGSAPDLLAQIEKERFSRGDSAIQTLDLMLDCDLLILDDLGAEFATNFTAATIYQIMNSRLNKGLPTIISTNLSYQEMLKNYGERVSSRLIGSYVPLFFTGQDVRQQKMTRNMK